MKLSCATCRRLGRHPNIPGPWCDAHSRRTTRGDYCERWQARPDGQAAPLDTRAAAAARLYR